MEVTKNGDFIYWTFPVTNTGSSADTNVKVQFNLPAGLAFQSYTAQKGTMNLSTGLWTIGGQNIGVTYSATVKYKVVDISLATAESDAYGFALSAVISGDNVDPNDVNNTGTAFVEITTCPPSAGAVGEDPACLCGSVATNDTPCTSGTTEYRLTIGSLVNLHADFELDVTTGEYNAMGMVLDPFLPASFTYSIWCIVGDEQLQTSGPATVAIPAMLRSDSFTDELVLNADGTYTHTSLSGVALSFDTFQTVYSAIILANITLTNLTLKNYTKIDDSGYADINIQLPDPSTLGYPAGKTMEWTFKRINNYDGGSITLTPVGALIDGAANYAFADTDKTSITIWTDGVDYLIK